MKRYTFRSPRRCQLTENTIPSFEKALELGADGFELDVRKTADGQLIVVHGSVVGGLAVQSSTYEQLRLPTWRGEVCERFVGRRRAPLGALGHGMPCPYILEPYVKHGEQGQRSNGGPLACFGRQVARNAG